MLYAKITDGVVEKYPYTLQDLKNDYPNVSFPSREKFINWPDYGCVEVLNDNIPVFDEFTQYIVKAITPVFENGEWIIKYIVTDKTPEQIKLQINGAVNGKVKVSWDNVINTGYAKLDYIMQCDKSDYEMMEDGLSLFLNTPVGLGGAGGDDTVLIIVRDKDNVPHEMSIADALVLSLEMKIYYWQQWQRKGIYRDSLVACTTPAEMEAIVF